MGVFDKYRTKLSGIVISGGDQDHGVFIAKKYPSDSTHRFWEAENYVDEVNLRVFVQNKIIFR